VEHICSECVCAPGEESLTGATAGAGANPGDAAEHWAPVAGGDGEAAQPRGPEQGEQLAPGGAHD